jgi:two-component system, sensor histidine kinase and response regulator
MYDYQIDVPHYLHGDPVRIEQVLTNIINNAVKFTEQGQIVLTVSTGNMQCMNDEVNIVIQLADTGIGIPQHKLTTIFDSFTQADASTTRKFGGSGLGLSISKQLVDIMHGKIWAESELTKGTTFFVDLPLKRAQDKHIHPLEIRPDYTNKRGLIIDPNATKSKILGTLLENWHFKIFTVQSGYEALELLSKQQFDIVFFDENTTDIDQDEFVAHFIKNKFADSKIVLTSKISSIDYTNKYCFGNLNQPIRRVELLTLLNRAFSDIAETTALIEKKIDKAFPATKILLAEDNQVNRMVVQQMMKRLGGEVIIARDGVEAVEQMSLHNDFDLILMDVQMPRMDGIEATKAIRTLDIGVQIPIIALTANVMSDTRDICLGSGMNDFITKPVKLDDLRNVMEKWIKVKSEKI